MARSGHNDRTQPANAYVKPPMHPLHITRTTTAQSFRTKEFFEEELTVPKLIEVVREWGLLNSNFEILSSAFGIKFSEKLKRHIPTINVKYRERR